MLTLTQLFTKILLVSCNEINITWPVLNKINTVPANFNKNLTLVKYKQLTVFTCPDLQAHLGS